ncbi:MAG: methyl-accepting chemotaxis protein [Myxococcota bacterium]
MSQDWLRGRTGWLLAPGVWVSALVLAIAVVYGGGVVRWEGSAVVPLTIAVVGVVLVFLATAASSRGLSTFRALVSQRVAATAPHRLEAISELRQFPSRAALWLGVAVELGALAVGLVVVVVEGAPLPIVARLAVVGALLGLVTAVLASTIATARVHEAIDHLAEGLPASDVLAAAARPTWTMRRRLVVLTLAVVVVPVLMVVDVSVTLTDEAAAALSSPLNQPSAVVGAASRELAVRLFALVAASLALSLTAAFFGGNVLARPMQRLAAEARRTARGELDRSSVIAADGEMWQVTGVFARMHERLAQLLVQLTRAGATIERTTTTLKGTSRQYESTAASQAAGLNQTSATTEELAHSARQIAASAASVSELAKSTLEAAEQGQRDAAAFQAAVDRMRQDNRSIAGAVDRLQRRVQQIGRIVELINTVADRSDLLALSAELEGTRAGDVGRGFSLVGAEMRRLAENVLESTAEVEELIAEIRDATVKTAEATVHGSSLTEGSTALAGEVITALRTVGELARQTSDEVRAISLATQQQQSGTDQLAETMSEILNVTQRGLVASHRLGEANRRLVGLSQQMRAALERFKVLDGRPGATGA